MYHPTYFNKTFLSACKNGNLEQAKLLLEAHPSKIFISSDDEFAFRQACENNHLDVAQWLLQVNPNINISAKCEYAFRWASIKNNLQVVRWIQEQKPFKYFIFTNDNQQNTWKINTDNEAMLGCILYVICYKLKQSSFSLF